MNRKRIKKVILVALFAAISLAPVYTQASVSDAFFGMPRIANHAFSSTLTSFTQGINLVQSSIDTTITKPLAQASVFQSIINFFSSLFTSDHSSVLTETPTTTTPTL